jgi:hypothetical protein
MRAQADTSTGVLPAVAARRSLFRSLLTFLETRCLTEANPCPAFPAGHPGRLEQSLAGHQGGWKGEYT